jgi:hypothetical protein
MEELLWNPNPALLRVQILLALNLSARKPLVLS